MLLTDKKYLKQAFKFGQLKRAWLVESPMNEGVWEMEFDVKNDDSIAAMTARGESKRFRSLEAARVFAQDIGFKSMEINW